MKELYKFELLSHSPDDPFSDILRDFNHYEYVVVKMDNQTYILKLICLCRIKSVKTQQEYTSLDTQYSSYVWDKRDKVIKKLFNGKTYPIVVLLRMMYQQQFESIFLMDNKELQSVLEGLDPVTAKQSWITLSLIESDKIDD